MWEYLQICLHWWHRVSSLLLIYFSVSNLEKKEKFVSMTNKNEQNFRKLQFRRIEISAEIMKLFGTLIYARANFKYFYDRFNFSRFNSNVPFHILHSQFITYISCFFVVFAFSWSLSNIHIKFACINLTIHVCIHFWDYFPLKKHIYVVLIRSLDQLMSVSEHYHRWILLPSMGTK